MANSTEPIANILLVDDQPKNLLALEAILEPLGQNLVKATSGREALKELLGRDFAAILLDVQMPDMDGFETAMLIRGREKTRHIPIVFLTAISKEERFVVRGYSVGAVDYITKPFEPEILRSKVAVFVELFKKNEVIKRQADLLRQAKEREVAEARQAGDERYFSLAEAMPQIVWVTDAAGTLRYGNRRWFDCAGLDPQEKRLDWRQVLHPADYHTFVERWTEVVREKKGWEAEFRFGSPRNGYRWHLVRALPVKGKGEVMSWTGTSTDIHDRRRAEEALRLLAGASETLATSIDYEGAIGKVAQLLVPRLGDACVITLQEQPGMGKTNVAHAMSAEARKLLPSGMSNGKGAEPLPSLSPSPALVEGVERRLVIQVAVHERVLGTLTLLRAPGGRAYDAADVALAEDVASRIAVAAENLRLYAVAEAERAKLEDVNRAKDVFLATLSHELRTPLNAMMGWAQILRAGILDETKRRRALDTIERNAKSQAELIADLLDVSRIVTGKLKLENTDVDLAVLVEGAVDAARPAADAKSVRLEAGIERVGMVSGDPVRLQQVTANLLSNAIKFTPAGGRVKITLERTDGRARLAVADDGLGIPESFVPYVFDRFRQADSSLTRKSGGLGLGLAIVKHLVEEHGGTVAAASEGENKGATFTVELPLREACEESGTKLDEGPAPSIAPNALAGIRVLIVEDDPDGRELIELMLRDYGATVISAATAGDALERLQSWGPDILVSDIGLPDLDGFALIRRVREMETGPRRMPAIALTAYASREDSARSIASGFDAHVPKPVEPMDLATAVARFAGRVARGEREEVVENGARITA